MIRKKHGIKRTYLIVGFIFIISGIVLHKFVQTPRFNSLEEKLEFYKNTKDYIWLKNTYKTLLVNDSLNINYHYEFINSHFKVKKKRKVRGSYIYRDDIEMLDFYEEKIKSDHHAVKDIGHFGLGLCRLHKEDWLKAENNLNKVNNKQLKFLNSSIGKLAFEKKDYKNAEKYFLLEIEYKGSLKEAYQQLARVYYQTNNDSAIQSIINDKYAYPYLPLYFKTHYYFEHLNYVKYYTVILGELYSNIDYAGLIAAFLIFMVYLVYLRQLDIYEPEKWKYIISTFILGMIFAELTYLLSDTLTYLTGFYLDGRFINDFFYCFIGIGVIEEFVKMIPLILIIWLTDEVNETIDYIVYASISALGFAFAENFQYFTNYGLNIIVGRALTSVVFHMFLSSLVAYGIIIGKYHDKKNTKVTIIKYFILAALIHGIYDFWLINESAKALSILSIILFVFCLTFFNTIIKNSISNSEFFTNDIILNKKKLQKYLIYSISGILLYQYILVSFRFGPFAGTKSLISSLMSGAYLIVFVSTGMGYIKIKKGKWEPFKFKLPFRYAIDHPDQDSIIGFKVQLFPFTRNNYLYEYLPNNGEIIARFEFDHIKDWYLIKLNTEIYTQPFSSNYILIRAKKKNNIPCTHPKEYVGVFLIRENSFIEKIEKQRNDVHFIGWALMKKYEK